MASEHTEDVPTVIIRKLLKVHPKNIKQQIVISQWWGRRIWKRFTTPPPPREAWSESREFSIQSLTRRCFIIAGHINVRSRDIQYLLHVGMILVAFLENRWCCARRGRGAKQRWGTALAIFAGHTGGGNNSKRYLLPFRTFGCPESPFR